MRALALTDGNRAAVARLLGFERISLEADEVFSHFLSESVFTHPGGLNTAPVLVRSFVGYSTYDFI
jgi:hypothetical protein